MHFMEQDAVAGPVQSFRDLRVWQEAFELTAIVYEVAATLPRDEIYNIASQMKRAAVSIALNIAEGNGRETRGEYSQFLGFANGSLNELETAIRLAKRLKMLTDIEPLLEHCYRVGRMLTGLRNAIRVKVGPGPVKPIKATSI